MVLIMSKTAKEMFEELGYIQRCNNKFVYYHQKEETFTNSIEFSKYEKEYCITGMKWCPLDSLQWTTMNKNNLFRDEYDKYSLRYGKWRSKYFNYVDIKLFKAINKQIEELGWNK
mgnify:CR=1 FL=1